MDIVHDFLTSMHGRMGDSFRIEADQPFLWLTPFPSAEQLRLSKMAHHALRRVREILPDLDPAPDAGGWPILVFASLDEQLAYESAFPGEGSRIINAGCWRNHPISHFALPISPGDSLDAALGHELVHAVLQPNKVPLWIQEGIAMGVEYHLGLRSSPLDHLDDWKETAAYWHGQGYDRFWSGLAFRTPDSSRHAYALAQVLMAPALPRVHEIKIADWSDEDQALKKLFGKNRAELVAEPRLGWLGRFLKALFGG